MSDAEDKSIDYRWLRLRPLNPNLLTDDDDSDLDESTKRKEIVRFSIFSILFMVPELYV